MSVDFSPVTALLGGACIGLAAVILFTTTGRVAGVSGIVSGAMASSGEERRWRVAFVVGLVLAGGLFLILNPPAAVQPHTHGPRLWLAGLLVGLGSRLGNGCTSGHGVCGIARFSRRSLIATLIFMGTGMATVWVLK